MGHDNIKLGSRRDFWNTNFNPITGFAVPKSINRPSRVITDHKAEYNFNQNL